MFVACITFVVMPDLEKAKEYDKLYEDDIDSNNDPFLDMTCTQYASDMNLWVKVMSGCHILCFIVNLFREVYETKLGSLGRFMRLFEVVSIIMYGFFIIQALWMISVQHYWAHFKNAFPEHQEDVRQCLTNKKMLYEISGTTTALAEIEVLVYFTFLLTIVLYITRSRCNKSGIDNSEQFEDTYMSYLVNKIIRNMVFVGKKYNRKFNA